MALRGGITEAQMAEALRIITEHMGRAPVVDDENRQICYTWYGPGRGRPVYVSLDDRRNENENLPASRVGIKLGIWAWDSYPLEWLESAYRLAGTLTRAGISRHMHHGGGAEIIVVEHDGDDDA